MKPVDDKNQIIENLIEIYKYFIQIFLIRI